MKYVVFTMDIDWASESVIDYSLNLFKDSGIPVCLFLTHPSKCIEELAASKRIAAEFGIHPNFFPGSTHGKTPEAVLEHCLEIVPSPVASRSHGLMFSSNILLALLKAGVRRDFSLISPLEEPRMKLSYDLLGGRLDRYAFNWEDDYFFYSSESKEGFYDPRQMKPLEYLVVNFHPIHVYLNSNSTRAYELYKQGTFEKSPGLGAETFLTALISKVKAGELVPLSLSQYFTRVDEFTS